MGRTRARERFFQQRDKREKAAAHAQAYGAGDVKTGLIVGEYPPKDYVKERLDHARTSK